MFELAGDDTEIRVQQLVASFRTRTKQTPEGSVWLGPALCDTTVYPQRAAFNHLGTENHTVVFNASDGFDCNAFAAISGTLVAGGQLLLAVPDLNCWHHDVESSRFSVWDRSEQLRSSHYLSRLAKAFKAIPVSPHEPYRGLRVLNSATTPHKATHDGTTPTRDNDWTRPATRQQQLLVRQLTSHVLNTTDRTFLLTGDRGRGKSAALGLMLAELAQASSALAPEHVILCGPNRAAVAVITQHYLCQSRGLSLTEARALTDESPFQFLPPEDVGDWLVETPRTNTALVIVDEAARIPLALLLAIIEKAPCSILSSTTVGYEGAGRGFALKMEDLLVKRRLPFATATLTHPRRWPPDDALEHYLNRLLMLDADNPSPTDQRTPSTAQTNIREIDQAALADNETLTRKIFGLLLHAHYRTTPMDLRHLMDGTNLKIWVLLVDDHVMGAALVASEGPIDDISVRQGILNRTRRPRGHVIPQVLAQFTGTIAALDLSVARIVRLAIQPKYQRQGLGSQFLQTLHGHYRDMGFDATCAMFSADPDARQFWLKNQYQPFHAGARPPAGHAYASLCVMRAVSSDAEPILERAVMLHNDQTQFHTGNNTAHDGPDSHYLDGPMLSQYHQGRRTFNDTQAAIARRIHRWAENQRHSESTNTTSDGADTFTEFEHRLMMLAATPGQSIASISTTTGIHDRKVCEQSLRACLQKLRGSTRC